MNLFTQLRVSNRLKMMAVLGLMSLYCFSLIAYRVEVSNKATFIFLLWNLFLAYIPYGMSTVLFLWEKNIQSAVILWICIFVWLVFYPNAPYILTDLFHFKVRKDIPIWYDLVLILSVAFNGLVLGLLSLLDIHLIIAKRHSAFVGWLFVLLSSFLCGFGIYLGRYLRWNSWDIVSQPTGLLKDLLDRITDPTAHGRTYGVAILFCVFILLAYFFVYVLAGSRRLVQQAH